MPEKIEDRTPLLDYKGSEELDLRGRDPHCVYIVTEKPKEVADYYRALGYYNVLACEDISQLSADSVAMFISTDFEDNRFIYAEESVRDFMKTKGSIGDSLVSLLRSIKERDSDLFSTIIKYNLDSFLSIASDLRRIYNEHSKLTVHELTVEGYRKRIEELEQSKDTSVEKTEEYTKLCRTYEILMSEHSKLQEQLETYQQENRSLINTIETFRNRISDMVESAEFQRIVADKDISEKKVLELQSENAKLTEKLEVLKKSADETEFFRNNPDELVKTLRSQLEAAKKSQSAEKIRESLPIVNDSTFIRATSILYLKEIKHIVYMNSLLEWLNAYFHSKMYCKTGTGQVLILVYDMMYDEYRKEKYELREFAINSAPKLDMVITSTFTLEYLKNVVEINKYEYVIVVDRTGLKVPIISNPLTHFYYFIDSEHDITDYKLNPDFCIGFYEGGTCKYHCLPNSTFGNMDKKQRMYSFQQSRWMQSILREVKIVE